MVPERQSRRHVLTKIATAAFGGVAGCMGTPERSSTDESTTTTSASPTPTETPRQQVPYFDDWMADVGNYDYTVVDRRGESTVTITVGATGNSGHFAFDPPVIQIDPETTIRWNWTAAEGVHTVTAKNGLFDSGNPVAEPGIHLTHTFETAGVYKYYCEPHRSLDMRGVVVVGDSYPTAPRSEVNPITETPERQRTDTEQTTTQEPTGPYGGYLDEVSNFGGSAVDWTGKSTVTIAVGAAGNGGHYAFAPPAVRIAPETTVKWDWTGNGGAHNVVAESGLFDSGDPVKEPGVHFEYTFETVDPYRYYCAPHRALEMKGVIEVVEP